jgi:CheY-like chemotaxis protein
MAYKLIVADASPSIQKSVQLAFPAPDWEIAPFDNGLELTKAIFEVHPDALLVSLALPGLDGYSVARFVRKQDEFRYTPLVFLRGAFEAFDAERAEGVDYDEIVAKPFDSAKLAVRLKNLIDAKGEHARFPESPIPAAEPAPSPAAAPGAPAPPPRTGAAQPRPATPGARPAEPAAPPSAPASPSAPTPTPVPAPPASSAAPSSSPLPADEMERRLKEWLGKELVEMEREIEKRVRNQISIELKKWFAEHYIGLPSKGK